MKSTDTYRKIPRQARALASVDAILEAAAQILQGGDGRFTTNAVAERAGVSIGTLYQYFPDKNAILIALARQELSLTGSAVTDSLSQRETGCELDERLRLAIRALIEGFHGRQRTRKALIEALIANGLSEELTRPVDEAMQDILSNAPRLPDGTIPEVRPVTAFVATRAIVGTLRAAIMEESSFIGSPEFEDELVRLAHTLLDSSH